MPDVGNFHFIIDLLSEIGPREVGWSELSGYTNQTGIYLTHWESLTIYRLSKLFDAKCNLYRDSLIAQPIVVQDPDEDNREVLMKNVQAILRAPRNG